MSQEDDRIGQQELRYFGKVTASISHELKNVLAILNEQAGLLRDYVAMAERGQPLDPARIGRLSATMAGQIGRGDSIIKRMNLFAHSVDQDSATVELDALVALVVALFDRTASTRGVSVEVQSAAEGVPITTAPFVLETLLGYLLEQLTTTAPTIKTIGIAVQADALCRITLTGMAGHADAVNSILATDVLQVLLAVLQASAGFDPTRGDVFITLPDTVAAQANDHRVKSIEGVKP